jgi:ferredoxin-NADP reductase
MIVLQFVLAKPDRTALQVGIGQFVTVVVHVETFE